MTAGMLVVVSLTSLLNSCQTDAPRVALIPPIVWVDGVPSDMVKIGTGMRGKVYVNVGGEWVESANKVDIPEGWWAVPPKPKE